MQNTYKESIVVGKQKVITSLSMFSTSSFVHSASKVWKKNKYSILM